MNEPKIEFRQNEKYCRWNGTLLDSEGKRDLFGTDFDEVEINKGRIFIYHNDQIFVECTESETIQDAIIYLLDASSFEDPNYYGSGYSLISNIRKITFSEDLIKDIKRLRVMSWMYRQIIDIEKLKEFLKDLNDYYENH